jgi:4-amino-4-deoxy-L-arabinose transferase-like glycosyltransferase
MRHLRGYCLLTLLCFCLYAPGLVNLPLFDRDEPHFAQASRQMLETQHYWQIYFQNEPRNLKPPGIYWLQASAVRLFSHAESTTVWPYRLPSALGAWLAVLLTFAYARRISTTKTAAMAATFLACSLLLVVEAHLAVTDAVLLATMVVMQFSLGEIYLRSQQRSWVGWGLPLAFWLAMAAGVLIKGITPLIAGLTLLGLYLANRRQTEWLSALRSSWGIPLLLALTAAWLLPLSLAGKDNFLWQMVRGDVLPKLSGGQQSHGMPPGYFSVIFTAAFWPASLFITATGVWAWRRRSEPLVRFLLAWIVPLWIFFECVPTKLPQYVLPAYPAIALLTALMLEHEKPRLQGWLSVLQISQQCLWALCTLALISALISLGGAGYLAAGLAVAGASYLFYLYYRPVWRTQPIVIGVLISASAFILVWQFLLPSLKQLWLSPEIVRLIQQKAPHPPSALHPLLAVSYREPSLVFLMGTHQVMMISLWNAIERAGRQSESLMLISPRDFPCFTELAENQKLRWQSLGKLTGFQYNHMENVTLYLILTLGVTHDLTDAHQTDFLDTVVRSRDHELLFCGPGYRHLSIPSRSATSLARHPVHEN